MRRWSKLQKRLYGLLVPGLRLQVHCRRYRMASQRGQTDLPRYWISLGKDIIWDYPKQFVNRPTKIETAPTDYPHNTDIPEISALIHDYIDTPRAQLMSRHFIDDHWGLINILRAADRRIGERQLTLLRRKTHNKAALKVIEARMRTERANTL